MVSHSPGEMSFMKMNLFGVFSSFSSSIHFYVAEERQERLLHEEAYFAIHELRDKAIKRFNILSAPGWLE